MTMRPPRRVLILVTAAVLLGSILTAAGCSATAPVGSSESTLPLATLPPGHSTLGAIGSDATTMMVTSGSADEEGPETETVLTPASTTAAGVPPATTGTTATTPGTAVMTYQATDASGPMTRVTRDDGAVLIIPADPTISQSPSLVVSVTVPPSVETQGVDIAGAKTAYYGWLDFGDRALQDPGKDWSAEAAKWAMEPHLSLILSELKQAASRHSRVEGHGSFYATVSSALPDEVQMRVCGDASGLDVVDDRTGKSIRANDGFRHVQYVTLMREASGRWLVSDIDSSSGETC